MTAVRQLFRATCTSYTGFFFFLVVSKQVSSFPDPEFLVLRYQDLIYIGVCISVFWLEYATYQL
jgi:hypothetical protein